MLGQNKQCEEAWTKSNRRRAAQSVNAQDMYIDFLYAPIRRWHIGSLRAA